ncbi:MAG: fimbrillin family protein [Rikenellaceae bacterium]
MKKILYILAVCALCFSCDKSESGSEPTLEKLTFSTSLNDYAAKGMPIEDISDFDNFDVNCYELIDNAYGYLEIDYNSYVKLETQWDGSLWRSSEDIYWQDASGYMIMASAPIANSDNGLEFYTDTYQMYMKYTMPVDVKNQPDLMLSGTDYSLAAKVFELKFYHCLSAVAFKVYGDTSRRVKSVGLKNIKDMGRVYLDEYSVVQWGLLEQSSYDNVFLADIDTSLVPGESSSEAVNITTDNGRLMVIPQTFTGSSSIIITHTADDGSDEKIEEITLKDFSLFENVLYELTVCVD